MIDFKMLTIDFPNYSEEDTDGFAVSVGDPVHVAVVANRSRRPIRQVTCSAGQQPGDEVFGLSPYRYEPVMIGRGSGKTAKPFFAPWIPASVERRIRPDKHVRSSSDPANRVLWDAEKVTFTDDAGLCWSIDHDQHLERLDEERSS